MTPSAPAIQIENLSYSYGSAEAVNDLGRCYGLFGRNGAGKTTTMKCLLNLLRPQRGHGKGSTRFGSMINGESVLSGVRAIATMWKSSTITSGKKRQI